LIHPTTTGSTTEWKMFALILAAVAVFIALAIYFGWNPSPIDPGLEIIQP
jgi:hypothetical protein